MTEIAYQNKDITSKIFSESLKEKSFEVYGIHLPKVKDVLPTNLPRIWVNELRMDNLFLLEDGSLALVDYESSFSRKDMIKYINYINRVYKKYAEEYPDMKIRMIVLYTCDVSRKNVQSMLNLGCLQVELTVGFFDEIDSLAVLKNLKTKVDNSESLTDEDIMRLVILPLTVKGKRKKEKLLRETIELAQKIADEEKQLMAIAGIVTFADKIISAKKSNELKEWIRMTKVDRLFEKEKQEALKQQKEEVTKEVTGGVTKRIAANMKKSGFTVEQIAKVTGLQTEDIEKL